MDEVLRIKNLFEEINSLGTYIDNQDSCQRQRNCILFSTWYAPFVMIIVCCHCKWVNHIVLYKQSLFAIYFIIYDDSNPLKLLTLSRNYRQSFQRHSDTLLNPVGKFVQFHARFPA